MINVLADKHLYNIREFLPNEIDLTLFDPQQPLQKIPDDTQALLIRTETKINRDRFPSLPPSLQFIATGSAGTDHIDIPYLHQNDVTFADAAGCNARSVAEYIATALIIWSDTKNIDLDGCSVGIIGVGNTGSEVQRLSNKLGIDTIVYDPPREERETDFQSASLDEVLASDILTFHTPLTVSVSYPTHHWLNDEKLKDRRFELIINTARGGVIDEDSLLNANKNNQVENYILDVWENEPNFNDEIAQNAFIKTPHIAGYSLQAKHNASATIAAALGEHFSLQMPKLPSPVKKDTVKPPSAITTIAALLNYLHPIKEYDRKFSSLIGTSEIEKKSGFSQIRTSHPLRHEYPFIKCPSTLLDRFPVLKILMNHKS